MLFAAAMAPGYKSWTRLKPNFNDISHLALDCGVEYQMVVQVELGLFLLLFQLPSSSAHLTNWTYTKSFTCLCIEVVWLSAILLTLRRASSYSTEPTIFALSITQFQHKWENLPEFLFFTALCRRI